MSNKKQSKTCGVPGNKNGIKLKDADIRQEAFRQYCKHLADGWPKESFFFDYPGHSVCWKTMDRYIRENPSEFPSILIEQAKAKRYSYWLDKGKSLMEGQFKNGSPVVWQTFMRNMFKETGWDKLDQNEEKSESLALAGLKDISAQLNDYRSSRSIDSSTNNNL